MDFSEIKSSRGIKTAIFSTILAFPEVYRLVTSGRFYITSHVHYLIYILIYASIAALVFIPRHTAFKAIPVGFLLIMRFIGLFKESHDINRISEINTIAYLFSVVVIGTLLLQILADSFNSEKLKQREKFLSKISVVFAVLYIIPRSINEIICVIYYIRDGYKYIGISVFKYWFRANVMDLIIEVIFVLSIFLFIGDVFPKNKKERKKNYGDNIVSNGSDYYISILKHVCLLLFTFGIWELIWIYKTTKYTNLADGREERTPTAALLLSMFVPFYFIYWTYKTAQKIDGIAKKSGIQSDMGTLCLLLAIFVPFVPPIIMQDKINQSIIGAENNPTGNSDEVSTIDALKKYQDLLDAGIITQEEFNAKKKQLLGL